jgi:hypothetical protein
MRTIFFLMGEVLGFIDSIGCYDVSAFVLSASSNVIFGRKISRKKVKTVKNGLRVRTAVRTEN